MFGVTGLKILSRVGTLTHFFFDKMPFKMHKIIYFPVNPKKRTLCFTSKYRQGQVNLNTGIFIWPADLDLQGFKKKAYNF